MNQDQSELDKLIRDILTFYIKMGISQDRATLCYKLRNAGQFEIAEHLRSL